MSKSTLVELLFAAIIIGIILAAVLGSLWAYDWDLKCLIAECRINK